MKKTMAGFFRKIRKRRILIISAGGLQGGLQCLYIAAANDAWEIIAHSSVPYPQKIARLLEQISTNSSLQIEFADLAWLDYKLSLLFSECARTTLTQLPTSLRVPHCAVLNKPFLWKGPTGEVQEPTNWDLPLGDAQHLASTLCIPVVTDLIRHHCIAGGQGIPPVNYGSLRIAASCGGIVVFLNIGLVSRMTIVDTGRDEILTDSDTGPGTCCINAVIKQCGSADENEGFDRDGSLAAQGSVDGDCLKKLSENPWFLKPAPKQASTRLFNDLVKLPQFTMLAEADRLATITALTARTIYDFYRREFQQLSSGQTVFLSGGGSHNQTLLQYLKTFFDTIPVKSVEELGIPVDMRIPLALGLTVNAYVGGTAIPWESGDNPKVQPLGKWVWP
ncbi:MAG: anhydro-N-acetylmuramic acid kinase [Chitinispirillaceae bacterium]|nr:anhydro-N-acetylmuramic acid kinase [Chitinispirillaceae bacterium]